MFDVLLTETIWLRDGNAGPENRRVLQNFTTADDAWRFYVHNRAKHEMLDDRRMVRITVCPAGTQDPTSLLDYYRTVISEAVFKAQDEDENFSINLDLWLKDRFPAKASA